MSQLSFCKQNLHLQFSSFMCAILYSIFTALIVTWIFWPIKIISVILRLVNDKVEQKQEVAKNRQTYQQQTELWNLSELILGFFQSGPTPPPDSQKGAKA